MPSTNLLAQANRITTSRDRPLLYPGTNKLTGAALLADINAGLTIWKPDSDQPITIRVTDFVFRPNGAFAGLTDIRLSTTEGTPTDIVTMAQVNLTDGNYLREGDTGVTTNVAAFLLDLAANTGLQLRKTGATATGATSLIFVVEFQIVKAPGLNIF